jgi:hypothetical protein
MENKFVVSVEKFPKPRAGRKFVGLSGLLCLVHKARDDLLYNAVSDVPQILPSVLHR